MDSLIIIAILAIILVMVPCAMYFLYKYIGNKNSNPASLGSEEMLDKLISAILDRSIDFDAQRITVYEMATLYRKILNEEDLEKADQGNVIKLFDHHLSQDKTHRL